MKKERLLAFTDAVLAIIMTICFVLIKMLPLPAVSGPYYKGIESFASVAGKSSAKILIIAECSEHDYRYVQHELNHALAMMFGENNIPIM